MLDPTPPLSDDNVKIYEQKHGKNWRRFTLTNRAVRVETHKENGDTQDTLFTFAQAGLPTGDYTEHKVDERSRLSKLSDYIAAGCMLGGLLLLANSFNGNQLIIGLPFYFAILLFLIMVAFIFMIRNGKANIRTFALWQGELSFYYRHVGEIDEVQSFINLYTQRAGAFWKTHLDSMIKSGTGNPDALIEVLHRNKVIDDDAYAHYKAEDKSASAWHA